MLSRRSWTASAQRASIHSPLPPCFDALHNTGKSDDGGIARDYSQTHSSTGEHIQFSSRTCMLDAISFKHPFR
jgi:hypothetical protein